MECSLSREKQIEMATIHSKINEDLYCIRELWDIINSKNVNYKFDNLTKKDVKKMIMNIHQAQTTITWLNNDLNNLTVFLKHLNF